MRNRLKMWRGPFIKYWKLPKNYSLEQFHTFCLSLRCSKEQLFGGLRRAGTNVCWHQQEVRTTKLN